MLIYIALIAGCLLLYKGGDWLLEGVIDFGNHMGWPKAMTGLLLVSLGTSAPELFVSLGAALQGQGEIAAGNVVGSNIINIAIVLGIAACVTTLQVERVLQNQLIALMIISIIAVAVLWGGHVSRLEGALLLIVLCAAFAYAFKLDVAAAKATQSEVTIKPERGFEKSVLYTIAGIVALLTGAEAMIWGGIGLADKLNVPKSVVALTVTALGTSLPEIAATIVAVTRRESALAVGNVIGSNLMNLGLVLGLSALIIPLKQINIDVLSLSLLLGLTLFVFVMGYKFKQFARWTGAALILSYIAYVVALVA